MTGPNSTPTQPSNENPPSPPPPPPPPPAQQPMFPAAQHQQTPSISQADGAAIMNAMAALPERIVNGIREATQAAAPPPPKAEPPKQETVKVEPPKNDPTPPNAPKSFAEWWFGR